MPGVLVGVHVGGSPASRALRQGSPHPSLLSSVSDYVIDDKVAVLQKRDHEGFGFVLRGAKGEEGRGGGGCRPPGVLRLAWSVARPGRPGAPLRAPPRPFATALFVVGSVRTRGGGFSSAMRRRSAVLSLTGAGFVAG